MIDSNMTVRDIALDYPFSTRILEELKIDYCCGGERPLSEACELAGVDFKALQEKLHEAQQATTSTKDSVDFQSTSLTELINYIVQTHHVFTTTEMNRLEALTTKVIAAHGMNHPELISISKTLQTLCDDLRPHMFKEERILFPYIVHMEAAALLGEKSLSPPFGTVNNPVRMMMMEHDNAGQLLRELRKLSSDYFVPDGVCIRYQTLYQAFEEFERDLHQHIHLENNVLFPKAIELERKVMMR